LIFEKLLNVGYVVLINGNSVKNMDKCPECGSSKLVRNREGLVCGKCGLVLEEEAMFSGAMII
jgi:ribosomal protein S27AE